MLACEWSYNLIRFYILNDSKYCQSEEVYPNQLTAQGMNSPSGMDSGTTIFFMFKPAEERRKPQRSEIVYKLFYILLSI